FNVLAYNANDDSAFSNRAGTDGSTSAAQSMVRDGATGVDAEITGTLGWSDRLGAADILGFYVANPDGTLTPDQVTRIQDAIASLNQTWDGSKGLLLFLVD